VGQRYVFWRTPTGAAYSGNDDKYAPRLLLEDIGKSAFINKDGNVAWRGWSFLQSEPAVLGSVVVLDPDGEELNRVDAASICLDAMRSLSKACGGSSPLEPAAFMQAANVVAAKHFHKVRTNYVLVTTLSVRSLPVKRLAVGKCRIEAIHDRTCYPLPTVLQDEQRFGELPKAEHPYVRVNTCGRTSHEAFDRGLEALLLTCGLWNLFATFRSWSIGFGGRRRNPVGVVHVGPIHTLHEPNGAPVGNYYWYEPDYAEHREPFNPQKGWENIEKGRRRAMGKMRRLPYATKLRELLVRYATALSKADPDVAFLQLWSILERITDTVGARYDETIRRATWIWPDGDFAGEVLGYLRNYRNQYVHAAASSADRAQVARLMKSFVDSHLLALLSDDFHVQSLEEYAACLNLPTSLDGLKRRREHLGQALRIRQSWSGRK
jgi:hypothetical protein